MKKVQPEIITYYCDSCNIELKGTDLKSECKITMQSEYLDYSGEAVGTGVGGDFDLCYDCYNEILNRLKK